MTLPHPAVDPGSTAGMKLGRLLAKISPKSRLQQSFDNQYRPYAGHHIVPTWKADTSNYYRVLRNLKLHYNHNSVDYNLMPMSRTPSNDRKAITSLHDGGHPDAYYDAIQTLTLDDLPKIYKTTVGKFVQSVEDLPDKVRNITQKQSRDVSLSDNDKLILSALREYSKQASRHVMGVNAVVSAKLVDQSSPFFLQFPKDPPESIVDQFKIDNPGKDFNEESFAAWQQKKWSELTLEKIKADARYQLAERHGVISMFGFDHPENSDGNPNQYAGRTTAGYDERSERASQQALDDLDDQYGKKIGRDGPNAQFSFDSNGNPSIDSDGHIAIQFARNTYVKNRNYERSERLSHFVRGGTVVAMGLLAGMVASAKATAMHLNEMALDPSFEWTMLDVLEAGGIDTSLFSEDFLDQLMKDMAVDAGVKVASRAIPFIGLALSAYDLIITAIYMPEIYGAAKGFVKSQVRLTVGSAQHKFYRKSLNVLNTIESKLGFEPDWQPAPAPYWNRGPSGGEPYRRSPVASAPFTLPPLIEADIPSLLEPPLNRQVLLNRLDRLAAAEGVDRETFLRRKLGFAAGENGNVQSAEEKIRFVEDLLGADLSEEEAQAFHDLEDSREEAQAEAGETGINSAEDHYHYSTGYQIGGMLGSIGRTLYDQFGGDSVAVGLAISAEGSSRCFR